MRSSNKGAIQLSLNFLVTIIIALVLLAAGIVLLRQFVDASVSVQVDVDQRTQDRLAALLDQGQQVAVPFSTKELKRGDEHTFVVGVLNILDEQQSAFKILIDSSTAVDKEGNNVPVELDEWVSYITDSFSIGKGKHHNARVLLTVPNSAPSGTYIFNVEVINTDSGERYDTLRKITVIIV
jgi:hypothetical protein